MRIKLLLNHIELRMAKTQWSFDHSECSRINLLLLLFVFCHKYSSMYILQYENYDNELNT